MKSLVFFFSLFLPLVAYSNLESSEDEGSLYVFQNDSSYPIGIRHWYQEEAAHKYTLTLEPEECASFDTRNDRNKQLIDVYYDKETEPSFYESLWNNTLDFFGESEEVLDEDKGRVLDSAVDLQVYHIDLKTIFQKGFGNHLVFKDMEDFDPSLSINNMIYNSKAPFFIRPISEVSPKCSSSKERV